MEEESTAAQHNIECNMLDITYKCRKPNKRVREQTKTQGILKIIKLRKWKLAGHISRRSDNRWTKRVTPWRPMDGNRNRERPHLRWRDEIEIYWGRVNRNNARDGATWHQHAEACVQLWTENS